MTMRMYILAYNAVFTARVNQADFSYPISEVTYDTVGIGPYTEILPGMTVLFGTTAGNDDLGRQRVKSADATKLYIGRSSNGARDGEVSLADDAHITVLDDFRVWSKIPYITDDGTIYKDGNIAHTDQTGLIPPKANGGPGMAGTISGGALEVEFSASASYSPVGAAISSVLWDVKDGTITVGTSASEDITAVFPAGFRYVDITANDANGKSHTAHIPVYARDPDADTSIGKFQIERHTITKEGQQLSIRILEDLSEATYLDGTLVMIWEDEPADGADRWHMRFIGWHHTDPASIRAERTGILRDTTFECLDVAGKLDTLPGFPVSVENKTTPDSWLEMSTANMDKYIDYLLRWHSTALEVANVTLSGTGANYPFVILGSDAGSLWEQVRRRAEALVPDCLLTCDTKGQIAIKPDPMIQATGDRTATVQAALTEADWTDIRYTHQRPPRVHWLRSEAVLASNSTIAAMFSVAPDNTPGQGIVEQTHGEQLARNQSDLNAAEGNRYGRLNATESHFSITLAEGSDQSIEPAAVTWVTMVISSATAAQRGLTLATARGLVHQVDIRYGYGRSGTTKTVTLTWERETSGLPAITYIPPETDIPIPYEPEPDPGFDPTPGITPGDGFGTLYVASDSELIRTRDFSASSPAYVDVAPVALSGDIYDFILDPYRPTTTGYLLTDDGVYKSEDLDLASPSWALVLDSADVLTTTGGAFNFAYKIIASINYDGYVGFAFQTSAGGTNGNLYYVYTLNGGTSWNYALVSNNNAWYGGGLDYVPHLVGGAIVLYIASSSGGNCRLIKSSNGGASWAIVNTQAGSLAKYLHCPYDGNEGGNIVYWQVTAANNDVNVIRRTTDSGGSSATMDIHDGEFYSGGTHAKRMGFETYTQNNQMMYCWRGVDDAGIVNEVYDILLSDDGGDTWIAQAVSGVSGAARASGGFPYQGSQFYLLTTGGIYVSTDRGSSWIDKTGDWTPSLSGTGSIGYGVIVPVWVAE